MRHQWSTGLAYLHLIFLKRVGMCSSSNGNYRKREKAAWEVRNWSTSIATSISQERLTLPQSRAYRMTPQLQISTSGPAYSLPITESLHYRLNRICSISWEQEIRLTSPIWLLEQRSSASRSWYAETRRLSWHWTNLHDTANDNDHCTDDR